MSGLTLRGVTLTLAGRPLIGPLELTIAPGIIVTLLGPSGVGKSSLLKFLSGVLPRALVSCGEVWLEGRNITDLPPQQRGVGILFQDDLLFPHLSVGGNLAFGLRAPERSRRGRTRLIEEALDSMGLTGFAARDPATLSGGQRARVGLLRVLLSRPRALLLDEPFAHLDPQTRADVRHVVFNAARQRNLPTLLVTHDTEDVAAAGGPCVKLKSSRWEESCSMPACRP